MKPGNGISHRLFDIFLNEEVAYKRGRAREERVTKNGGSRVPLKWERQLQAIFAAYPIKIS